MRRSGVSESTTVKVSSLPSCADREHQPVLDDGELERVGAVVAAVQREAVALEDVEHRHLALVLDVGAAAPDRGLVEGDGDELRLGGGVELGRLEHRARPSRLAVAAAEADGDRAAVGLETLGARERHGGGRQGLRARAASSRRIEVRFMKSSTPSPEEKRALRAVGSTWLEPAT